jgi:proline iminopeptidase
MTARSVETPDGASLFLNEIGPETGPPVVVLHGGPAAHHEYLLPAFARLADPFRLVLYDQRGGGRSRVGADVALGFDAHIEDVATVIRSVSPDPVHVVGYSFGGLIAMVFAARHPDLVRRLALCSSPPPHHGYRAPLEAALAAAQSSPWVQSERHALEASGLRDLLPDEYRRRRFCLSVAGYFADPRLAYGLTPFRVQSRTADVIREGLGPYDFTEEVAKLDGRRVLFLHGDRDPIRPALLRPLADATGARFEELAGSGHVPYLEATERFFSILRGFLGDPI